MKKVFSQKIKKAVTKILLSLPLLLFLANPALATEKTVVIPFEVFSIKNSIKNYGEIMAITLEESFNLSGEFRIIGENQQEEVIKKLNIEKSELDKPENISKIGKYLGVNRVISGVIEQVGDLFKATIKMTEVKTGKNIFSQTIKEKNLALLQEKIINNFLNSEKINLSEDKKKYLKLVRPIIRKPEVVENYLRARKSYYLGSFLGLEKAEKYLLKVLAEDPDFTPAELWLAKTQIIKAFIYSQNQENFSLLKIREKTENELKKTYYHPEWLKIKGLISFLQGDFAESKKILNKFLQKYPLDSEANLFYCLVEKQIINKTDFEKITELNPFSVITYLTYGKSLENSSNYEEALENYDRALEISEENDLIRIYQANIYLLQGYEQKAQLKLEEVLRINPELWLVYTKTGELALKKNDPERALENFQKALKIKNNSAFLNFALGKIYYDKAELNESEKYFREALAISPDFAEVYFRIGLIHQNQGKYEEASKEYAKALILNHKSPDLHYNQAIILNFQDKISESLAEYRKALEIKPNFPDVYYNMALIFKKKGEIAEAISAYEKAIELKPDFGEAYINLGSIFFEMNKLAEAERCYLEAIKIRVDYAKAYNNLGSVYFSKGEMEKAIVNFKRALEIKPDYGSALANLALVYYKQGKKKEAEAEMLKACNSGYIPACNLVDNK